MKTLKRTLGLVLALVLIVSLFSVAAGASFTDEEKIQYEEPVAILTGAGIIEGYPDGSFAPQGDVTRAEAAKMIAYAVLGADVASKLVCEKAPFDDVAADSWCAPYVAWCADQGIIAGYGNGCFGPKDNITSVQLAAMILRAVGYGQAGEYLGKRWADATMADALKFGVFADTNETNFKDNATREEAALYMFNGFSAIQVVKYFSLINQYVGQTDVESNPVYILDTYYVNGVVVANDETVAAAEDETALDDITVTHAAFVSDAQGGDTYPGFRPTFGLSAGYDGSIEETEGAVIDAVTTVDEIGHNMTFAFVNGVNVAQFDNVGLVKTFESTGDINADLKAAGFKAADKHDVNSYDDNVDYTFLNYIYEVSERYNYEMSAGLIVNVVDNDGDGIADAINVNYNYFIEADLTTDSDACETTLDASELDTPVSAIDVKDIVNGDKLVDGEYALLSQIGDFFTVETLNTVKGEVERWSDVGDYVEMTLVIGGKEYTCYTNYNKNIADLWIEGPADTKIDVILYFDVAGNIIAAEKETLATDIVYIADTYAIVDISYNEDGYGSVNLDADYYVQAVSTSGEIVKYQVTKSEFFNINSQLSALTNAKGIVADVVTLRDGISAFGENDTHAFVESYWNGGLSGKETNMLINNKSYVFNSDLTFIYTELVDDHNPLTKDELKVSTAKGLQSIPANESYYVLFNEAENGTRYVYAVILEDVTRVDNEGVIWFTEEQLETPVWVAGDNSYAWYLGYVDGVETMVKIDNDEAEWDELSSNTFLTYAVDADGFAKFGTQVGAGYVENKGVTEVASAENLIITTDSGNYGYKYADDVVVIGADDVTDLVEESIDMIVVDGVVTVIYVNEF